VFHAARPQAANPVIKEDQPWEMAIGWTSVYRDPASGKYQLWYQAYAGHRDERKTHQCVVCYAESDDGVRFVKPKLGLFDFQDVQETNIVLIGSGGYGDRYCCSVLVEPGDPDPARRYKMLYYDFSRDAEGREWPAWHAAFSPDGVHWTKSEAGPLNQTAYGGRETQPPLAGEDVYSETPYKGAVRKAWRSPFSMSDAVDVFYDPLRSAYVVYGKCWLNGPAGGLAWKHAMARSESKDFLHWSKPQLVAAPDEHDPPNLEFHTSPVFFHKGVYFCLNQLLKARGETLGVKRPDTMEIELMTSRDGLRWERPFRGQRLLPYVGEADFASGSVFTNSTPVVLDDEIRFYYGGYTSGATGGGKSITDASQQSGVGFASLPLDRFAGIRPVEVSAQPTLRRPLENIGQITLRPLSLAGRREITLNGDAGQGSIRVELLTEDGYRVRGFTIDDAVGITGDSLRHAVTWNGGQLSDLPPGSYMLRVHLDNAEVFALTLK
jgi:hypothetical protein